MATRLSRRLIARHAADRLLNGEADVLAKLAAHLIETRRTGEVDLIVRDIEAALADSGVVVADVASAHELSQVLQDGVTAYIAAQTGAKKVQIRTSVDESLIGGVRITTPNAEFDTTVKRQLMKLQAMKV